MVKKLLVFAAALLCATAVWAQTNVALGKHVFLIGDALNSDITEEKLQIFTDGSTTAETNIWDSSTGQCQSFYIDLGQEYSLGAITIYWEGACGSDYTVKTGTKADDDSEITWGDAIVTQTGLTGASGVNQMATYKVDATTRYLRFDCTKAFEASWGVKIFEFYAYETYTQQLTNLSFSQNVFAYNENQAVNFTSTLTDQIDVPFVSEVSYSVSPETATVAANGTSLTPTAAGLYKVTATSGDYSVTRSIGLIGEAPADPTDASDDVLNFFCDTYDSSSQPGWTNSAWNWGNSGWDLLTVNNHRYMLVKNVGTFGFVVNNDLSDYETLHASIYVAEDTKGYVDFENNIDKIEFNLTGGQWNDLSLDVTNIKQTVSYCQFYLGESKYSKAGTAAFTNMYFVKTAVEDTEAPTINSATVSDVTATQAVLTVNATDAISSKIYYTVTDQSNNQYTDTGTSGTDCAITLTGLTPATAYTLAIVAKDAKGNATTYGTSVTFTTAEQTTPNIPNPEDEHTGILSIYSPYTGNVDGYSFQNWSATSVGANVDINGKTAFQISKFTYFGSGWANDNDIDATDYTALHLDILPQQDMTLTIVPITRNPENAQANAPEKGIQFSVKADQWNGIELPVETMIEKGANMAAMWQIKYVSTCTTNDNGVGDGFGNGNGTESFIVGNVYLYGKTSTDPEDTSKPVVQTLEPTHHGSAIVTMKVNATDDKEGTLTYNYEVYKISKTSTKDEAGKKVTTITSTLAASGTTTGNAGEDATFTVGDLEGYTYYAFNVTATDADGNVSALKSDTIQTMPGEGGSGETTAGYNGTEDGDVTYIYEFVEYDGIVTFYIIADGSEAKDYMKETYIDNYSVDATVGHETTTDVKYTDEKVDNKSFREYQNINTISWSLVKASSDINVQCWWAVQTRRDYTPMLTYKVRGYYTGVDETAIVQPQQPQDNNIYSIDGRVVRQGTTSTTGLPQGIYIVNHKKVFVR